MEYIERNKPKSEQTAKASSYPQGYFKIKPCRNCNEEFQPNAPSEMYCSDGCKNRGIQNKYFQRLYGISVDDYESMYKNQEGLCSICNEEGFIMDESRHKLKLVVDHCHRTEVVRGLLCHNCNRALGLLKDDISRFYRAIDYLKVQRLSERSTSEANADGSAQPLKEGMFTEIYREMKMNGSLDRILKGDDIV